MPSTLSPAPPAERTAGALVTEASVGMGQIALLSPDGVGRTVLGSCVGLLLIEPTRKIASLAHIVLPKSSNKPATPGKFVDTAVVEMLDLFRRQGIDSARLIAKLTGGANMFDSKGPIQIGRENVEAVRAQLTSRKIPLTGEHVGGTQGRRITFDCRTGWLLIEVAGAGPVRI